MITLVPFEQEDFARFISWIQSAEDLQQFAGPYFSFPLDQEQLHKYISDPKRCPYKIKLTAENRIIGHAELNYERPIPRLSRILLADRADRGKGLGKMIVNKLLTILFVERGFDAADLNVYDWNHGAIACYKALGFVETDTPPSETRINGKTWKSFHMGIKKRDWLAVNNN